MAEYLKLFMICIYMAYQEIFYVIDNLDEMPFILQYNQITKIVIDVSLNHNASYLSKPMPLLLLNRLTNHLINNVIIFTITFYLLGFYRKW